MPIIFCNIYSVYLYQQTLKNFISKRKILDAEKRRKFENT